MCLPFSLYLKGDVTFLLFLHRNVLFGDRYYVLFWAYSGTHQADSDCCFCCTYMESSGCGNSFQNLYVLFVVTFLLKLISLILEHIEEPFKNDCESEYFKGDMSMSIKCKK